MAENRYAILIGLNDYEINPLDFCANDVDVVADCLERHCNTSLNNIFPIKSTYNQPIEDVRNSFDKALSRIQSKFIAGEDSIIFYFSGHGVPAKNSTTLLFKNAVVTLQELFARFTALKPKFIFFLIDSCYSGVGIEDGIEKSAAFYEFNQHLAAATGYNIFCASAHDKPAKEDSNLQNGRFTRLFVDIVSNKLNYRDGLLSLNIIYQLLDEVFKTNPAFRQLPFSQNKGLSTYPLAFVDPENENGHHYSNHYIDDIEEYDWKRVMVEIKKYTGITNDSINEFVRLIREILRNSIRWGKANHVQLEISNNSVTLIDDSGVHFDIFSPPAGTNERGGVTTAKTFATHFSDIYEYEVTINNSVVYQKFTFKVIQERDPCKLSIQDAPLIRALVMGNSIEIPPDCKKYIIEIQQGYLDLSWSHMFLRTLVESSVKSNVPVIVRIDDNDRLKNNIKQALTWVDINKGNVSIE